MSIRAALLGCVFFVATVSVGLVACGGADDRQADSGPAPSPTAGESQPSPTAASHPAEALWGEWRTTISPGDDVTLTLRDGAYTIRRGPARGSGRVEATTAEALFSGSDLCDGTGTYTWTVQGETLSFVSVSKDACGGRSEVLDGKTYHK